MVIINEWGNKRVIEEDEGSSDRRDTKYKTKRKPYCNHPLESELHNP